MDPRLQDLQTRLDDLVSRCQAVTLALQKSPDIKERGQLAAELRAITAEMNSLNAERCALAEELNLTPKQRDGDT